MDPHPGETLTEYLGELGAGLAGYLFSALGATRFAWNAEVQANWKVLKDAFQEVWHIPTLHHRSIPNVFSDATNKYGHALEFRLYPRHGRISLPAISRASPRRLKGLPYVMAPAR
jgi:hypothetical protein